MASTEVSPIDGVLDELDYVLLRQVPFIALVPDELRTLVLHMFRKESFAFGEEICREGEVPHSLYVLGSGSARVVTRHGEAEVMLARVVPGELFGEDALVESERRVETVRASEDVTVYRLARETFDALADEVPAIADALRRHIRLEEIRRTLRVQPAFATIQLSVLSRFFEGFEVLNLRAQEIVVSEGSASQGVYVVARGTLAVVRADQTVVGYLRSGDCFGERAALTDHVTEASVVAQSDVEVIRVANSVLRELMDASPRFAARMKEMADLASAGREVPVEAPATPTSAPSAALSATDAAIAQGSAPLRSSAREGRRATRFPFVAQFDESDCGVACLAMVSRHFGRKVSTAFLRDAAGTGVQGTSLTGITQAGRAAGLSVEPVHASAERLDEYQLPAIVHYKGNHWIVLYDVTPTHVYVADPAIGLRQLARADFERDWTGYAAFVARTDALDEAPVDNLALGWLVPFLLEQRAALVFSLVLALALAGCEVGVPVVINSLVNSLTSRNALSSVNGAGLALLGLVLAGLAISFVANRVIVKVTIGFDTHSLDFLTGKLLHLPMSYFARRKIGDLERRISGMRMIRVLLIQDGVTAGTNVLLLVVAIVMMLVYSWVLGLIFLAVLPLYGAVMWYSKTKLRPIFASAEEAHGLYQAHQVDLLKGVETVKTLGAETGLQERMRSFLGDLNSQLAPAYLAVGRYQTIATALTLATYAFFVYLGALFVHGHSLSLGRYVAFMSLVLIATAPILGLLLFWDDMQNSTVLLARIHDVLVQEPEQGSEDASLLAVPTLHGEISLRDVEYRPHGSDRAILSNINLEIPAGSTVALVGRSGCGKSTLLRLLAGLITPTSGSISYDGVDIADVRLQALRARIGYVLQAPYVFDATVAENIAFGSPDIDPDALRRAAQIADVDTFVDLLPLGFDTRIGEGGMTLSGGQAQRISIARALYRDPPVIFFDEATSALDAESEQTIKRNMDTLSKGRTTFIVTHRLASIRDADLIVVLDAGRVIETGDHATLLANDGLYAHLFHQQYANAPSV